MAGTSHQYQILASGSLSGVKGTAALHMPAQDAGHLDLARGMALGPLRRVLEELGNEAAIDQDTIPSRLTSGVTTCQPGVPTR